MVCWNISNSLRIHFDDFPSSKASFRPRISHKNFHFIIDRCFFPFFDVADSQSPTQACSLGGRKIALAPQAAVGSGKPWKGMEIMDKKRKKHNVFGGVLCFDLGFSQFFTKKTHVPIGFHRRSSVESDLFVVRSCWPMFFTLVSASSHLGYSIWTWLNDVDRWIWVDDVDGYFFYRLVDISPAGLWGAPHLDFDPKCEPQRFLDNYLVHWLDCIC